MCHENGRMGFFRQGRHFCFQLGDRVPSMLLKRGGGLIRAQFMAGRGLLKRGLCYHLGFLNRFYLGKFVCTSNTTMCLVTKQTAIPPPKKKIKKCAPVPRCPTGTLFNQAHQVIIVQNKSSYK